mgnify:FL=1
MTSTEVRKNFNSVIHSIESEPVAVAKQHKKIAVILSFDRYQELKSMEDFFYGKVSELAIHEGFVSSKERDGLLDNI